MLIFTENFVKGEWDLKAEKLRKLNRLEKEVIPTERLKMFSRFQKPFL